MKPAGTVWTQRTKPRVRRLVSSCLAVVGIGYPTFIRAFYNLKHRSQDRLARVARSLRRARTDVLDGLGIEHHFWVGDQHLEGRVRRRRARSDARWNRPVVRPTERPRVLLIADVTAGFPLLLNGFLSWGLWLRGVPNSIVECDGGLPVCDAKKVTFPDTSCRDCHASKSNLLDAFGLDPIRVGQYVSPAEIEAAWQAVRDLTWEECQRFEHHELPLGTFARVSLHAYFLVGEVVPDEHGLAVYRKFLATGLVMVSFYERLLEHTGAEHLFILNGQYLGWRIALELGRRRGLNVVTWELGQLADTIFLCVNGFAASSASVPELWKARGAQPLAAEHREVIERYLSARRGGDQGIVQYNVHDPRLNRGTLRSSLGIAPGARVIALFTNVEWDSAVFDRHRAFQDQWDWICTSIEAGARMPGTHWVIRIHPGEVAIASLQARRALGERLREVYPEMPANVSLIEATTPLSSYALIDNADVVVAYASTIGLESACLGKPVVVIGQTHYAGCGFTLDVDTRESYLSFVAQCLEDPGRGTDVERALSYAHFFFFRSMIRHDGIFKHGQLFSVTDFVLEDFEPLAPGGDEMVDLCCRVILGEAQPVVSDAYLRTRGGA